MPVYEYECPACGSRQEIISARPDGGEATVPCDKCEEKAGKVISMPNIAKIKSGFKESDAVYQDPETGEMIPMGKDYMITGTPREEESQATRDQLDLMGDLEKGKITQAEYEERKAQLDMKALDSDADGKDVDPEEMDSYWKTPGELDDEKRQGLSYPKDPLPDGMVKVGEVNVDADDGKGPQLTDVVIDTKDKMKEKVKK